ncbi:MAG: 50S ribosomal protein L21, partial [Candidatus Dormibacteria bacterium]
MYAILSHGGRQYRVSAGDRLLVDRLAAQVGSVLALEPVLLTGGDGSTVLGKEVDGVRVAVTVLGHPRGRKLRIFKYKAKKRSRTMAGYRSDLTELRVESILARGAAVPTAAAAPAGRPARRRA